MTDPIADMLSRIRNAVTAKGTRVDRPASRLKAGRYREERYGNDSKDRKRS